MDNRASRTGPRVSVRMDFASSGPPRVKLAQLAAIQNVNVDMSVVGRDDQLSVGNHGRAELAVGETAGLDQFLKPAAGTGRRGVVGAYRSLHRLHVRVPVEGRGRPDDAVLAAVGGQSKHPSGHSPEVGLGWVG